MITLAFMTVSDFLNKKFLEWQYQEGERKTISEFAKLFDISQGLMTMWMNGTRSPGPEYKERIIERYGDEAILAFGDDPDLYAVINNWNFYSPEERRAFREQAEKKALENEAQRTSTKRRTRTT